MSSTSRPARTYSRRSLTKAVTADLHNSPNGETIKTTRKHLTTHTDTESDNESSSLGQQRSHKRLKTPQPVTPASNSPPRIRTYTARNSNNRRSTTEADSHVGDHSGQSSKQVVNNTTLSKSRNTNALFDPSVRSPSGSPSSSPNKLSPRPLSELFELDSPRRRLASPSDSNASNATPSATKRMLGRSRTESSIASSPDRVNLLLSKTKSLVDVRTKDINASPPKHQSDESQEYSQSDSQSQQPRQAASLRRTYAGTSRSFLVALPASTVMSRLGRSIESQDSIEDHDGEVRDSYSDLRRRYGVDNSEQDPGASNDAEVSENLGLYNNLLSITDMRSKGESRRFLDEVGYLFEGLSPSAGIGVRRSTALDVVTKLCDPEFRKRAKAADFTGKAWQLITDSQEYQQDKILGLIAAFFAFIIAQDPNDFSDLVAGNNSLTVLFEALVVNQGQDLLETVPNLTQASLTRLGLKKPDEVLLKQLFKLVGEQFGLSDESCEPCVRNLVTSSFVENASLAFPNILEIVQTLDGELAKLSPRISAFSSGLALIPSDKKDWFNGRFCAKNALNCLEILDAFLVDPPDDSTSYDELMSEAYDRRVSLVDGLISLLVASEIAERLDEKNELQRRAPVFLELTFRILINLSNEGASWCRQISDNPSVLLHLLSIIMSSYLEYSQSQVKKEDEDEDNIRSRYLDRLCLALALLTNLLQELKSLPRKLKKTKRSPSCARGRKCLPDCRCPEAADFSSNLASIYSSLQSEINNDPDRHFLQGHLAVLFGLILMHNPKDLSVLNELPGGSLLNKLNALIDKVTEFSTIYASMTNRFGPKSGSDVVADVVGTSVGTSSQGRGSSRSTDVMSRIIDALAEIRRSQL